MIHLETYWNDRFTNDGMIWGQDPSKTVYHAMDVFKNHQVKTVLVPGSGYGRNTKALSAQFQVDGIELSSHAIHIAEKWDPKSQFIRGSVLNQPIENKKYDAIYCFDVLHLFLKHDRDKFIHNCSQQLSDSGLMYFACFSNEDPNNGIGTKLEDGTYEYVEGKYAHFFTETDLIHHFEGFQVIETGTTKEILTYNDNRTKEYILRYIIVKKA